MVEEALSSVDLSQKSTEELKQELLELVKDKDSEPPSKKVAFYKQQLAPFFEELSHRNPFPKGEDQVQLVLGTWSPVWSTIPFQDIFPGRIHEQSYQIFLDNGYYANMARYAPGHKLPVLRQLASRLLTYDFMILQKFEVQAGQWHIQNVGIEQAFRLNVAPLSLDKAKGWLTKTVQTRLQKSEATADLESMNFENVDRSTAKQYEKIFRATPQLEHLYIDREFRLVKTQREAKQRPSYTIAVRKSN